MNSWFQGKELPKFLHQLYTAQKVPLKYAAHVVGRQPNSNIWMLSPDVQVSSNGKVIHPDEAPYYWIPPEIAYLSKAKVHIPSPDLCPVIHTPLLADPKDALIPTFCI